MIGILDYGMGNLSSIAKVIEYLGVKYRFINSEDIFADCSHLIIPGVGAYEKAINNIASTNYIKHIHDFATSGKPLLGICLGMQLLSDRGFEPKECNGLGLIQGDVVLMNFDGMRIPHVGWNGIEIINNHPILEDVKPSADFYFVHSYYFKPTNKNCIVAQTNYGTNFPSIICNTKKNIVGIQFHPEKSQKQGLKIMDNFVKMTPC